MKIINSRVHGILDYTMGILLIASPWIFGFADDGAAQWIPIIVGISQIIYSLCTNFELGPVKLISLRTHLNLDMVAGLFLAVSPWIFQFHEYVFLPHLILGLLEFGAGLFTDPIPYQLPRRRHDMYMK